MNILIRKSDGLILEVREDSAEIYEPNEDLEWVKGEATEADLRKLYSKESETITEIPQPVRPPDPITVLTARVTSLEERVAALEAKKP